MKDVVEKKYISLVALILILIIVLIILSVAVIVTSINVPQTTEYTTKMHNHAVVQNAVVMHIMASMSDEANNSNPSAIVAKLYNIENADWSEDAATKLGIPLTQEELQATFTLDNKGVVGWELEQEPILETKEVTSIEITSMPTTTTYITGDKVNMFGLVVIANYKDNTISDITKKCTFSPTLSEITKTVGTKEITISYQEQTAIKKITITVELPNENWIESNLNPNNPCVGEAVTKQGITTKYYAPVPHGFQIVSETTISQGLVIEDSDANQFVWVPVNNSYNITNALGTTITGKTALEYWQDNVNGTGTEGSGFNEPYPRTEPEEIWTKTEWDSMYESVIKYGGFYIGRYETGYEMVENTKKPVVKSGVNVWNNIPWNNTNAMLLEPRNGTATYIARNMYSIDRTDIGVVSTLIYGIQWDSVMNWANCANKTRATNTYSTKPSLAGALYNDGETYDVEKNIYDLAGNVQEWSMEAKDSSNRIVRGGNFGKLNNVEYRDNFTPYKSNNTSSQLGFRIALYVK